MIYDDLGWWWWSTRLRSQLSLWIVGGGLHPFITREVASFRPQGVKSPALGILSG